ncbi:hypothetical protein DFJ77DRAFT_425695 [Powellomyces hirtus]|nr:hypothetical protein DFJ77DRAFT_425695 [Powellomyces hirtus]
MTITRIPAHRHFNPALQNFGAVCRQWRRVSLHHPFWSELAWHRLLSLKPLSLSVDRLFDAMAENTLRMARIRSVRLDLVCWKRNIGIDTLLRVLRRIAYPHLVHTVILEAGWDVCGDTQLVRLIASHFPNLRRIHIGGTPSPNVFHGLASAALKHWANHWQAGKLTHLSLQGYGEAGSFSSSSLLSLLATQTSIKHLSIGYVRRKADLRQVAKLLPNVESLSVDFTAIAKEGPETANSSSAFHATWRKMDLSMFKNLRTLIFQDCPNISHEVQIHSAHINLIIGRLVQSREKLEDLRVPPNFSISSEGKKVLDKFPKLRSIRIRKRLEQDERALLMTSSNLQLTG